MPLGGNCSLSFLNASHIDWNKLLQQSSIGLLEVTASETAISVVSITASHMDSLIPTYLAKQALLASFWTDSKKKQRRSS